MRAANIWHRIKFENPYLTHGAQLSDFLEKNLSDAIRGCMVVVAAIEGSGDPVRGLTLLDCALITIAELHARLLATEQIDWGDFYFVKESGEALRQKLREKATIQNAISESHLALRVIDDSSIEVFTTDHNLISTLSALHLSAQIESASLAEMDYPQ